MADIKEEKLLQNVEKDITVLKLLLARHFDTLSTFKHSRMYAEVMELARKHCPED